MSVARMKQSMHDFSREYEPPVNEFRWGNPRTIFFACWVEFLAEFLGTLWLVFFGTGAAVTYLIDGVDAAAVLGIAFTFGFGITTIVYAIGGLSHAHINPAVTFSILCLKNISFFKALMYIFSQLAGALVGSALVLGVFPSDIAEPISYGANLLATNQPTVWQRTKWTVSPGRGFLIEVLMTSFFVFTILATSKVYKNQRNKVGKFAPLAVGLAAFVCHCVGIRMTGCSINPARSFGPAVISGEWKDHYIFWLGPLTGGGLAALTYKYVFLFPHVDDIFDQEKAVEAEEEEEE